MGSITIVSNRSKESLSLNCRKLVIVGKTHTSLSYPLIGFCLHLWVKGMCICIFVCLRVTCQAGHSKLRWNRKGQKEQNNDYFVHSHFMTSSILSFHFYIQFQKKEVHCKSEKSGPFSKDPEAANAMVPSIQTNQVMSHLSVYTPLHIVF